MKEQDVPDDRQRDQRRSPRRAGFMTLVLVGFLLPLAACSDGSVQSVVASVSRTPAAGQPSSEGSPKPSGLAYARCMQSHGITNFPEPDSNGNLALKQGMPLPDANSPQFKAAAKACVALNPAGVAPNAAQQAQHLTDAVAYATCMRSHGVSTFPDPGSDGSFKLGGIDPASSQVQAADKACARNGVGLTSGRAS